MKYTNLFASISLFLLCAAALPAQQLTTPDALTLRYDQPAQYWEEALPLGNGILGAMWWGKPHNDVIQLNHSGLWSGAPRNWNNPDAKKVFPEVKKMMAEGRYFEAQELLKKMQGPYTQGYLPLGNLYLDYLDSIKFAERTLHLPTATAKLVRKDAGRTVTEEMFISHPDGVMVLHLQGSGGAKIAFHAA